MSNKTYRDTLPEGYELHWFELQSVLGRGGYGVTYLAVDKNLDRKVAVKEYLPVDFAARQDDKTVAPRSSDQQEMYQWGLTRFLNEARTLAKFNHPNIVRVISVFEHNGTAYMVMEYEQGRDLSTVFKEQAFFSEDELLDIFIPVIDGLSLVHQEGFIHRDIKPSNIYIRDDKSPVLLDFGSARQSSGQTRTMTSLVTYGYAPFEQYNEGNEKQGPWTDIYSLGATLYFGITKKKPEDAMRRGGCILVRSPDPYQPVSVLAKGKYSENFLLTIDNALRFRAEERPQDTHTWAQMLLGNIKAPPLPVEAAPEVTELADNTMIMPKPRTGQPNTGESSRSNTGRLIDASGRRVTTGYNVEQTTAPEVEAEAVVSVAAATKKSGKGIGLAIAGVMVVAVVVLVLLMADKETVSLPQADQVKTVAPEPPPAEPQLAEPQQAESPQTEPQLASVNEIATLLSLAEDDFVAGRVVKPEGNNAAYHFSQVLQLDPSNKQARDGIDKIALYYSDAAKKALNQGNLREAESDLDILDRVAPGLPVAMELRLRVSALKDKNTTIETLLREAQRNYVARRLTEPEGDNALAGYNKVLEIDPANEDAKNGIENIFKYYVATAKTQLSAGNAGNVEDILLKMDAMHPDSAEALDIRRRLKTIATQDVKLSKMLDLAYQAYRSGRFIEPASNNAFAYYRQALKIDATNARAIEGIANIRNYYKREFDKYLAGNQLEMAEKMANGLKVVETDPRVVAKAFQDLSNKKTPARPEVEVISELVGEFKKTLESKDLKRIREISEFAPGREQFVEQFYANYHSVKVKISDFDIIAKEHKGKANILFDQLINSKGHPVQAGAWGKFEIIVQKNKLQQWRVFW